MLLFWSIVVLEFQSNIIISCQKYKKTNRVQFFSKKRLSCPKKNHWGLKLLVPDKNCTILELRLIRREDIEPARWNGCVYYAHNSRVYGYTWYLDNVCDAWDGLVEGNYESVFPLVWKEKLGIKQLYQPLLCQQLGLFSVHVCSPTRLRAFLEAIPAEYRQINVQLNAGNGGFKPPEGFSIEERPNYVLLLDQPYEALRAQYSSNLKRNLKKAEQVGFYLNPTVKPETLAEMARAHHQAQGNPVPEAVYYTMMRLAYNAQHRGLGTILGAFRDSDHELCAAMLLVNNGPRMINLFNASTPAGLEQGAMPWLIDQLIQQNAGKPRVLDFEGSAIEGVARFYQSFGAELEPYYRLKAERLPWWAKFWYR